ncbi:MAG: PQQ-binding-like beta-propeller repeat protein [Thermoplasmata archaeon]|nr:MAG: PQQ-binding-like beta-propeller repeat protein [Thermoplasmata archaeon]
MKVMEKSTQNHVVIYLSIILILSTLVSATSGVANDDDWLMYRYDDKRTGNSPLTSNIVEPAVKWSFLTGAAVKSPPTVGDINNDGEYEVVFGSNDDHLYALDRFGSELWNFSALGDIVNSPSIGDVDGDGKNEIVFGGYFDNTGDPNLYVLNGEDGSKIWRFESNVSGGIFRGFQSSPLLLDINDDGINDVLLGSQDEYFYALNGPDGSILWRSFEFEHFVRASSPIGDLDKDGELELIVIDNHAIIRSYNAKTGALEWEQDVGYGVEATPVLADVNGDTFDEIIVFTIGGNGSSGDAVVLYHNGSELWRSSAHTYFYTSPTLLDIDSDGLEDIIGGDSNDHTIVAYKGTNGAILWETVLPNSTWSQAPLVTADIDGDGVIEVICGAYPNLYCLSTLDGAIEWTFETTGHIWGQPCIADIEQDGLAEVIFGCHDNYLYVLENRYKPPIAHAGENQIVYEGDEVKFDGTGSYDPDGPIGAYEWDFDAEIDSNGDGDPQDDIDATGPRSTHIYGDDGIFIVTLTVTDEQGLSDTDTCNITVLNVDPTVEIESVTMDVKIGLRVAGSKWSNVGLTLYADENHAGYLEVERWPGSPDDNPTYEDPLLPTTLDLSKSYSAIVTYDPYPDVGDEIEGDQPNNGKDKQNNAGNPVWIILRFEDGSEERIHHTFNTQQSKKRDSDHPNHVEPWEVDLNAYFVGHSFEVTSHITDPGSDDEALTYTYGSQAASVEYLNNPPTPDPYPSPDVNPRDIYDTTILTYEGPGSLTLSVEDDDSGINIVIVYIA